MSLFKFNLMFNVLNILKHVVDDFSGFIATLTKGKRLTNMHSQWTDDITPKGVKVGA